MNADTTMIVRDVFMRHTTKEGSSYVIAHRAFDVPLFVASQAEAAAKEGGKCKAEQITHQQYLTERKAR